MAACRPPNGDQLPLVSYQYLYEHMVLQPKLQNQPSGGSPPLPALFLRKASRGFGMHALIIEDDVITAILIEDELRDLGYSSFDTASTEQEAIEAVGRRCPDLVTSDGALLVGSGAGAVHHIRTSLQVPVIFITEDPEQARKFLTDAPMLEKPFSVSQLITAVEQAQPAREKA